MHTRRVQQPCAEPRTGILRLLAETVGSERYQGLHRSSQEYQLLKLTMSNHGEALPVDGMRTVALEAERMGCESIWTTDRILMPAGRALFRRPLSARIGISKTFSSTVSSFGSRLKPLYLRTVRYFRGIYGNTHNQIC